MALDDYGKLAIAELVYWTPALLLAILVTFKHGFGRQLGWFFIILLALARIIGASCLIAAEEETNPSDGLLTASAITSSIGVSFLIQGLLGLLTRVISGTPNIVKLPGQVWRLLHILLLVGIILGIVGGVDLSNGGNDTNTALSLLKGSVMLFLVGILIVAFGLFTAAVNLRMVPHGERRLIIACLVALPFVFVRLVYSILNVFIDDSTFNYFHPSIWIKAFMAVFMEFVAAGIIIAAGFMTQKAPKREEEPYPYTHGVPLAAPQNNA